MMDQYLLAIDIRPGTPKRCYSRGQDSRLVWANVSTAT